MAYKSRTKHCTDFFLILNIGIDFWKFFYKESVYLQYRLCTIKNYFCVILQTLILYHVCSSFCLYIYLSGVFFTCLSLSLFVKFFVPMGKLSLFSTSLYLYFKSILLQCNLPIYSVFISYKTMIYFALMLFSIDP